MAGKGAQTVIRAFILNPISALDIDSDGLDGNNIYRWNHCINFRHGVHAEASRM